jgi:glutaredoxin
MTARILFFTQPGCLSCEFMKFFLEARDIAFEEFDISTDSEARRLMTDRHGSRETPTLVVFLTGAENEVGKVVVGFDPALLDQLLEPAPSPGAVTES